MEETMNAIQSAVTNGGGAITWQQMLDAVPQHLHRHIRPALVQLKADNRVKSRVDGTVSPPTHHLVLATGG